MVMTVMSSPPKRALLSGGSSEKSQKELKRTARLIRAMGKIPMICPGNSKHPNEIKGDADPKCGPAKAGPNNKETADMDQPEYGLFEDVYRRKICGKIARVH